MSVFKGHQDAQSSHLPRSLPHTETPSSACAAWKRIPLSCLASLPVCLRCLESATGGLLHLPLTSLSHSTKEKHLHLNFKQAKILSKSPVGCGRIDQQARPAVLLAGGDVEISAATISHSLAFGQLLSDRSDFLSDSPYMLSLPQPRFESAAVAIRQTTVLRDLKRRSTETLNVGPPRP